MRYLLAAILATFLGGFTFKVFSNTPPPPPSLPFYEPHSVPQMAAVPPPNAWRIQVEVAIAVSKPRLTLPREALSRVLEKQETKQQVVGGGLSLPHLLPAVVLAGLGLLLLRGRTRAVFAKGFLVLAVVSFGTSHDRLEAAPPGVVPKVKLGDLLLEDVEIVVKPEQDAITLTLPPSLLPRLHISDIFRDTDRTGLRKR